MQEKKKAPSLPTYKEMYGSLTPHTTEYLLKDRINFELVYNDVTESLKLLEVERFEENGSSVVSAMEPVDGEEYLNKRLDVLGDINKYVTDMMENIELQLVEHLNSYDEGE